MTDSELTHLVKMANQIADNLSRRDPIEVVADRTADHMKRFWAPSMKAKIIEYIKDDGADLREAAKLAVAQMSSASN